MGIKHNKKANEREKNANIAKYMSINVLIVDENNINNKKVIMLIYNVRSARILFPNVVYWDATGSYIVDSLWPRGVELEQSVFVRFQ